tara:strand:- start:1854 stop:2855 length:1002 start_codon:yes stop_codon:yes gene_type:complete
MNPEEIIRQRREQDKFLGDERYKALQEIWKKYGKDSPEAKAAAEEYQGMNLKRPGEIEAREGRRKDAELYRQMLKDSGDRVDRLNIRDIAETGFEYPSIERWRNERHWDDELEGREWLARYEDRGKRHFHLPDDEYDNKLGIYPDVQFDPSVAEQELRKEEGVLPESITPDLLMAGPGEGEGDISEREQIAANARVLPKSLTPELLMAEDDSETPMSAISVLRKIQAEEELPVEKQDKPNGIPRVDTSDLTSDMDMGVDDLELGNEGQYSDSMIAEEEERGGGFRKPTYRSTHYERTKNLPPSKLAEKMQANKERRQMKRLMRKTMEGRRNAK